MPYQARPGRRTFARRTSGSTNYRQSSNKRGGRKDNINPSRFIKPATPIKDVVAYVPENSFMDFEVNYVLQSNLSENGILYPTPIQDKTIPLALEGRDIIGIANTGTGKTIAFALPILHKAMADTTIKTLIVAPTRELAQQIEAEFRMIAKGSGLRGAVLIGGTAMTPQLRDLSSNPAIVIGTPGRIRDHVERGSLNLGQFSIAALDEVDRMLDMGFITDMRYILSKLAQPRQSFFFSATMTPAVQSIISEFSTNDAATISVKTGETTDNVDQNVVQYNHDGEKPDKLHDILVGSESAKVLVFEETQRDVERLHIELQGRGFRTEAIHGGRSQSQRQRALKSFKENKVNILVATDVAARGIDISDITHVINYSVPKTYDDYVHRIGRAGRAGRAGTALTFVKR